jgi:hypothetical protein
MPLRGRMVTQGYTDSPARQAAAPRTTVRAAVLSGGVPNGVVMTVVRSAFSASVSTGLGGCIIPAHPTADTIISNAIARM